MAEKNTAEKKPTEKKAATKKATEKKTTNKRVEKPEAPIVMPEPPAEVVTVEEKKLEPITHETRVQVASIVHGELLWISKRTGYRITWGAFGEKNTMTVGELFEMRNSDRTFFTHNWITIEDPRSDEILEMLGMQKYYHTIHSVADFDDLILRTDPDEMKDLIIALPYNTKETLARRAKALREEGVLDSERITRIIAEATGFTD